jgi:inner membrane protein YidH
MKSHGSRNAKKWTREIQRGQSAVASESQSNLVGIPNPRQISERGSTASNEATDLARERTWLAHERTLMAWVRTATSLISFGFTIYKFFDYMQDDRPTGVRGVISPRGYAAMMIGAGLVALALASVQHARYMKQLRKAGGFAQYSVATVIGILVSLMGITTLVAVIFHQ